MALDEMSYIFKWKKKLQFSNVKCKEYKLVVNEIFIASINLAVFIIVTLIYTCFLGLANTVPPNQSRDW